MLVYLNDPETHDKGPLLKSYEDLSFLGQEMDYETMIKVAECEICPITKQPFKLMVEEKMQKERE